MRKLGYLALGIVGIATVGCGAGSSQPDEAKLHQALSGPPSLEGMSNRPRGARQPAGQTAGGTAATTGGAPAPATTGQ